jgi:O-antigen/teichoic acid export membrane protein
MRVSQRLDVLSLFKKRGRGLVTSSFIRILATGMGVLASVAVARFGGPQIKGEVATLAAVSAIGFSLVSLDLGQQIARISRNGGASARGLVAGLVTVYLVAFGALAGLLLTRHSATGWSVLGAAAYTVSAQAAVVAIAYRGAQTGAIGAALQQGMLLIAVCALFLLDRLTSGTAKLALLLAYLAPFVYYWTRIPNSLAPRGNSSVRALMRAGRDGLPWQLGRVAQFGLLRLDVIAVALIAGSATAGIYSTGLGVSSLLGIVSLVVAGDTYHKAHLGNQLSMKRQVLTAIVPPLALAVPLLVFGQWLITALYGPEFRSAYIAMVVTVPGVVAYGVVQVTTSYVRVEGTWKSFAWICLPALLVMVVGLAIFVAIDPIIGAGLAYSLAAALAACLGLVQASRIARGRQISRTLNREVQQT